MTTPASPLTDDEIERKIRNAEQQLAHQENGFFVPFEEYIPVYRELLDRRAECARLEGYLTEAVENHNATRWAFGEQAAIEHRRAIDAEDEIRRLQWQVDDLEGKHDERCPSCHEKLLVLPIREHINRPMIDQTWACTNCGWIYREAGSAHINDVEYLPGYAPNDNSDPSGQGAEGQE